MLRPKALDHVGLKVTDMDKTLHFYSKVRGLELLRTSGPDADGGFLSEHGGGLGRRSHC
jgi:catechol 2,3-dioxygenase-like lactoylglutathione lyase family enzyme